jgi:type I restriction enzyme S subunit
MPWVTPKDMKVWEVVDAQIHISQQAIENSAAKVVPENTVLLVVRSGVLKHTAPVAINRRPVAINQDMKSLECNGRLAPEYLARFLRSSEPAILGWVRATTADNYPIDNIRRLPIPLPSLSEQKRIAAILDQADDLRRNRRAALERFRRICFATFVEMFGDPIANPKEWPTSLSLGDVAEIVSGITKGRKLNGSTTRPVPYLAVANVQDRKLALDFVKTIDATEPEIERYRLLKDDLVLTEGGDPDKLGRGALWNNQIYDCIHQNHIFRVRLAAEVANPVFVNWLVGGPRGKAYFLKSAKQTTGIASINMTQLREFPLILPPIEDQREFAARVVEFDNVEVHYRNHLAKLDSLFASLQHRAFRGEL